MILSVRSTPRSTPRRRSVTFDFNAKIHLFILNQCLGGERENIDALKLVVPDYFVETECGRLIDLLREYETPEGAEELCTKIRCLLG